MTETAAHEQTETIIEHDLIAEHVERAETAEFRHNKAVLVTLAHGRCWWNTDLCDYDAPIEAHHISEWSQWPNVDPVRLAAYLLRFDPYGLSAQQSGKPIESPDDIRNLILLCDRCHRGIGLGAHHLSSSIHLARHLRRDGVSVTEEELQLRVRLAATPAPATIAVQVPAGSTVVVQTPQEPMP